MATPETNRALEYRDQELQRVQAFNRSFRKEAAEAQGISEAHATARMLPPSQVGLFRMLASQITLEDIAKNRAISAPIDWPNGYLDAYGLMVELEGFEVFSLNESKVTWHLTDFGKEVIPFLYQD